jgi:hypothetical protein
MSKGVKVFIRYIIYVKLIKTISSYLLYANEFD